MSNPVYLLVLAQGVTEAWHQLTEAEQSELWAKVQDVDRRAGAQGHIRCDSRWADESISGWSVIEYPDMDSNQR